MLGGTGWRQGQAWGGAVSTRAIGLGPPWGPCGLEFTDLSSCGPAGAGEGAGSGRGASLAG